MGFIPLLALFSLFHLVDPYSPEEVEEFFKLCPPFECGKLGRIIFPFTNKTSPKNCGPFIVDHCDKEHQQIQLERGKGRWYEIENISQSNTMFLTDREYQEQLNSRPCQSFDNFSLPSLPYALFRIEPNITLFKCNPTTNLTNPHFDFNYTECTNFSIYYTHISRTLPINPPNCSVVHLPLHGNPDNDIFRSITSEFTLELYYWWPECYWCEVYGGKCQSNRKDKALCVDENGKRIPLPWKTTKPKGQRELAWKIAIGISSFAAVLIFLCIIFTRQYKREYASSHILSTINSSNPSSKSNLEGDNVHLEVPIFSYAELEEATSNFDPEMELGNGGFGTVYFGKLRDGRKVAVKRLYEHDYRRVKLFMNEIEILAHLHHRNLVCLYGCTSVRSRELLLVYEYIPNGTVAEHIHGDRAKPSSLTWPIRMRIAIETASALAYLHASDIIHRDVKTHNILLDSNYNVKVADFGLSRLFPTDATHISTAPQGTPGYVDPEYHQCYQLTSKSDVYSFGVVLAELISSMPAVDITRHRHEINLANLAIKKIQKCALDELIDPSLGHQSDGEIKRMITSVAELAFLCLQQDKEMRPSMDEVLEELQRTESGECDELDNLEDRHDNEKDLKNTEPQPSQGDCDEIALLKNIQQPPPSPNSVTYKWLSSSSTASKSSY